MKRVFIVLIVVVVAVFAFFAINHFFIRDDSQGYSPDTTEVNSYRGETPSNQEEYKPLEESACENPVFTAYFVDPEKVQKVGQVGVVHGSGLYIVERSYVSIKPELGSEKIPVYAPVDMTLRSGSHYTNPAMTTPSALPDYALWFDVGCQVEVNLAHLKEVVPSIGDQLTDIKTDSRSIQLQPIQFNAGDLIGYFIYHEGDVAGFDFIVRDKKVVNQFINQERYSGMRASNLLNGVCPYDYFVEEKKQAYYNLLGGPGGTRFTVPDCGKPSRDVPGALSGMWFLDKEPQENIYDGYKDGNYGSTLSIVGDEEAVIVGNLGQSRTSRVYHANPTYKLPEQVTGEHCYQFDGFNPSETAGWVYFSIVSDTELDVVFSQTGTCPLAFPGNAKRYYK